MALALATIVQGEFALSQQAWSVALNRGARPEICLELASSAHLFCGFPRSINGLEALASVFEDRGIKIDQDHEVHQEAPQDRRQRGHDLFTSIYAHSTSAVLSHLQSLHAPFQQWILEHAYGRVLSRALLSGADRELLSLPALVVLNVPRQLRSHLRGAKRLGQPQAQIRKMVEITHSLVAPDVWRRAEHALELEGL